MSSLSVKFKPDYAPEPEPEPSPNVRLGSTPNPNPNPNLYLDPNHYPDATRLWVESHHALIGVPTCYAHGQLAHHLARVSSPIMRLWHHTIIIQLTSSPGTLAATLPTLTLPITFRYRTPPNPKPDRRHLVHNPRATRWGVQLALRLGSGLGLGLDLGLDLATIRVAVSLVS